MVIGATVLAFLVLLLLLAERGSTQLWQGGRGGTFFYCRPCDLRYPKHELVNSADRICPKGHFVEPDNDDIPFSTIFIFACVVFIAVAVVLIASGRVQ